MHRRAYEHFVIAYLLVVILAQAAFAAFPGIDLAVSGLFANGQAGFPWAQGPLSTMNAILRRTIEALALATVLWCLIGALLGELRRDQLRAWAFAALTVLLASGWLVNMVLKTHVGRARPAEILAFGGESFFTPAWRVTDQCADNCSFTSGEVSLVASLVIPALVLFWPRLTTPKARVLAVMGGMALIGLVAFLRIGLGRHFLSDAVFSFLISAGVALVLYPVLRVAQAAQVFDPLLPLRATLRGWHKGKVRTRNLLRRLT